MMTKRLPSRRPALLAGLLAVFLTALGCVFAAPALAHTRLISSTPGKDATAANVTQIKLVFSDQIRAAKVVVKNAKGEEFQDGDAERSGKDVTQKLKGALPAGDYTVAWRVVGEDGHPIQNADLTFTAEQDGGATASATPSNAPSAAAPQITPAKAEKPAEKAPKAPIWIVVVVGVLVGIGVGLVIVRRAVRKNPTAGGRE